MPNAAPTHRPHVRIGSAWSYEGPPRQSAYRRGYGGRRWEILRRQVFRRDLYRCRECGGLCIEGCHDWRRRPHCDHIVPKPAGADDPSNLQTLCGSCHSTKTGKERGGGAK